MANLTSFIYCLNAERNQNPQGKGETINANGVLTVMSPEFIPGTFSFSIIFSILDVNIEQSGLVVVIFKDSEGKEIINTGTLTIPSSPIDGVLELPKEYIGYNLCMDFRNVVFEHEGEYMTEIYFNSTLIGQQAIYVKGIRK